MGDRPNSRILLGRRGFGQGRACRSKGPCRSEGVGVATGSLAFRRRNASAPRTQALGRNFACSSRVCEGGGASGVDETRCPESFQRPGWPRMGDCTGLASRSGSPINEGGPGLLVSSLRTFIACSKQRRQGDLASLADLSPAKPALMGRRGGARPEPFGLAPFPARSDH